MAPSYGGTRAAASYTLFSALNRKSCEVSLGHPKAKISTGTSVFLP